MPRSIDCQTMSRIASFGFGDQFWGNCYKTFIYNCNFYTRIINYNSWPSLVEARCRQLVFNVRLGQKCLVREERTNNY